MKKSIALVSALAVIAGGAFFSVQASAADPTAKFTNPVVPVQGQVSVQVSNIPKLKKSDGSACPTYQEVFREVGDKRVWYGSVASDAATWAFTNTLPLGEYSDLKLRLRVDCSGDQLPAAIDQVINLGKLTVDGSHAAQLSATKIDKGGSAVLSITGYPQNKVVAVKIVNSKGVDVDGWHYSINANNQGVGSVEISAADRQPGSYSAIVSAEGVSDRKLAFSIGQAFDENLHLPMIRVQGGNGFGDAAALSNFGQYPQGGVVYLTTTRVFTDAASAGPAAFLRDAPLLLSGNTALAPATKAELARLKPSKVYMLGSTWSLSADVEAGVKAAVGPDAEIVRIAGNNSFRTSVLVTQDSFPDGADTVFVATDRHFSDSVTSTPIAARMHAPILMASYRGRDQDLTVNEIKRLGAKNVVILGSSWSLPFSLDDKVKKLGVNVSRVTGNNAHHTAVLLAEKYVPAAEVNRAFLATDASFQNGLAAAPTVARTSGVLLLSKPSCVQGYTKNYLAAVKPPQLVLIGNTSTLATSVESLKGC